MYITSRFLGHAVRNNISADISLNGQKLEEVTSLKFLGATLCIRIASAMAATVRLNRIWRSNTSTFASEFKLYKALVT